MITLQRPKMESTVVTVIMRPLKRRGETPSWALALRAYPVIENGKRKEKLEYLNRVITTPIWDVKRAKKKGKNVDCPVKRDVNGVIMCESTVDKEACIYAQNIRNQRQREYEVAHIYEGHEKELAALESKKSEDFVAYYEHLVEQREADRHISSVALMQSAKYFKKFMKNKALRFDRIDVKLLNNYRSWIQKQPSKVSSGTLSPNTVRTYFMYLRSALRQAFHDGYLDIDLHSKVVAIPKQIKSRDSFSKEEIQTLYETPCKNKVMKRAALFCVYTGLRLGDLRNLKWSQLRNTGNGWRVDIVQGKTKRSNFIPISDQALELCGKYTSPDEHIFPNLNQTAYFKQSLNKWLKDAGINRHMTFHCFRHTFATLQLESGTDIYTIKSMLGHTSVNTTQIYTHIVDPNLREAVEKLYIDGLTIEF